MINTPIMSISSKVYGQDSDCLKVESFPQKGLVVVTRGTWKEQDDCHDWSVGIIVSGPDLIAAVQNALNVPE